MFREAVPLPRVHFAKTAELVGGGKRTFEYSFDFGHEGTSSDFESLNISHLELRGDKLIYVDDLYVERRHGSDDSFCHHLRIGESIIMVDSDGTIRTNADQVTTKKAFMYLELLKRVIIAGSVIVKPENTDKMTSTLATLNRLQKAIGNKINAMDKVEHGESKGLNMIYKGSGGGMTHDASVPVQKYSLST